MNSEMETLARRAVACKGWRWLPGMLTADGWRVVWRDKDGYTTAYGNGYRTYLTQVTNKFCPDLSDPATLGALLALVRETRQAPAACVQSSAIGQWTLTRFLETEGRWDKLCEWHSSEAAALVAALEVANG